MIPGERSESLYLSDILEAIDRILSYTSGGREAFFADPRTQDAVARNIEIIGEATRGVSEATKAAHPELPCRRSGRKWRRSGPGSLGAGGATRRRGRPVGRA